MLNRRYLAWLIAGAYAAPQGGFRPPESLAPQPAIAAPTAPVVPAFAAATTPPAAPARG